MEKLLGIEIRRKAFSLRPTSTTVRHRDGRIVIERAELLSASEQEKKREAARKAEFSSLHIPRRALDVSAKKNVNFSASRLIDLDWQNNFPPSSSHLRCVTYNVWFSSTSELARRNALFQILHRENPDIIALQEVKSDFAEAIRKNSISKYYAISSNPIHHYGCLLLVRRSIVKSITFNELVFSKSAMGRTSPYSDITFPNGKSIRISSCHLESLNSERTRRAQLIELSNLYTSTFGMILGDFNFDATKTYGEWKIKSNARSFEQLENTLTLKKALPGWIDAWGTLYGNEDPGYTFDGKINRPAIQDTLERMRYDRVMLKNVKPVAAKLLGTKPINNLGMRPSDHFGVEIDVEYKR